MRSKLFLPFLLLLVLLPSTFCFGQSLTEAKAIIKEQAAMLERFEMLTMRLQTDLNAKDRALIEASDKLTILKAELKQQQEQNKIDQREMQRLKILWSNHEIYDAEQKNSLTARQTERDIFIGIAAAIAAGWLVDRLAFR